MHEIKCPHCGKTFNIDEAGYADILKQVRDEAFDKALHERLALAEQDKRTAIELAETKIASEMEKEAAKKDAEIEQRRQEAIDYKRYFQELLALVTKIDKHESDTVYPEWAYTGAQRALYDFGFTTAETAKDVDCVVMESKPHDWVGNRMKEKVVAKAIRRTLPDEDAERFDELFDLVRARDEYR